MSVRGAPGSGAASPLATTSCIFQSSRGRRQPAGLVCSAALTPEAKAVVQTAALAKDQSSGWPQMCAYRVAEIVGA